MNYLKAIETMLDENQTKALKGIYEPTVVGVPLADSRQHVCVMPNGEIRAYFHIHGK